MRQFVPSIYATGIDPLLFYQDADIDHAPLLAQYYQYLQTNNFDAASYYLSHQAELDFYGAWLLNTVEDRLHTVEEHIDEFVEEKPKIVMYAEKEPHEYMGLNDDNKFYNWTGGVLPYTIALDMDSYNSDPIDEDVWNAIERYGQYPTRDVRILIKDEDGNSMNLRELYNTLIPVNEDNLSTPSDQELVEMLKFRSSNESAIVLKFDTDYYSGDYHAAVENPRALITGMFMGQSNLRVSFDRVKGKDQKCVVSDYGDMYHEYYLTTDPDYPHIYCPNSSVDNGRIHLIDYQGQSNNELYMLKDSTSQFVCDPTSYNYYNIFSYNGATFDIGNPIVLSIDNSNTIQSYTDGTSTVTIIPKEEFVGTDAYQSGTYNFHNYINILDVDGINMDLFLETPWYGGGNPIRSRDFVVFPSSGYMYFRTQVSSTCANTEYPLMTYEASEGSGYFTGVPMGHDIVYEISEDLEYRTDYDGNLLVITLPEEWDVNGYPGTTFDINVVVNGLPIPLSRTQQISVAPEQDHVAFIPGHDENITLAAVGDTTRLPLIVYANDPVESGYYTVVDEPRFIPIYTYQYPYDTRVVNIDSYGNVTALREGSASYQVRYGGGSVTFNFTVGS